MSDYYDYIADEDCEDEVIEYLREQEEKKERENARFKQAVAAEVRRQLSEKKADTGNKITEPRQSGQVSRSASKGSTKTVNCECCGAQFEARVADLNRGWARFCSKSCKAKNQEKKTGQFKRYLASTLL